MVGGTERAPRRRLALLLVGLVALGPPSGCALGVVRTHGYRIERALHFERAATDGRQLWLAYRGELRDRAGEPRGEVERTAVLRLADLEPGSTIPIDEFPLVRTAPRDVAWDALHEISLGEAGPSGEARLIVVRAEAGEHGLLLRDVPGAPEGAQLRAAALTRRFHTGWSHPLLAPAGLWDLFWGPQLLFFGVPLFLWND